jgi:hypothetical protein
MTFSGREVLRAKGLSLRCPPPSWPRRRSAIVRADAAASTRSKTRRYKPRGRKLRKIDPRRDHALRHAHWRRSDHPAASANARWCIRRWSMHCRYFRLDEPVFAHLPALPACPDSEHRRHVHTFLFGTRLTNITRQMRNIAISTMAIDDSANAQSKDWSGGTRIGEALRLFNRQWSRRVLGQGAVVILITDGLERDSIEELGCRDRPAAPVLPPADLAQSALAFRWF